MGPQCVRAEKDSDPDPSVCSEEITPGRAHELRESTGKQGRGQRPQPRLMLLAMHRDAADPSYLQECCPKGSCPIPKGCDSRAQSLPGSSSTQFSDSTFLMKEPSKERQFQCLQGDAALSSSYMAPADSLRGWEGRRAFLPSSTSASCTSSSVSICCVHVDPHQGV